MALKDYRVNTATYSTRFLLMSIPPLIGGQIQRLDE